MKKLKTQVKDFSDFTDLVPKSWKNADRVTREDIISNGKNKKPFVILEIFKKSFKSKLKGKKKNKAGTYDAVFIKFYMKEAPKLLMYTAITAGTVISQLDEHKKDLPFACTYWHVKGGAYGKYDALRGTNG